jgi:hypothetical protein
MEPSNSTQNIANLFNPEKFVLKGSFNPILGQDGFPNPFLYLTIMPNMDFKLRVTCHFKPGLVSKKKPMTELEGVDPFIEQLRRQKENNLVNDSEEIFTLGEGGSIT